MSLGDGLRLFGRSVLAMVVALVHELKGDGGSGNDGGWVMVNGESL